MLRALSLAFAAALLLFAGIAIGRHRSARAELPATHETAAAEPVRERSLSAGLPRSLPPAATAPAPTPTAPAAAPPTELRPADVRDHMERVFVDEKPDLNWSRTAERTAETRLRSLMPEGGTLRSVECRASLCRIETSHEGLDEYREFVERAFMKMDTQVWNGPSYSTPLDDKAAEHGFPLTFVSFLAREGHELPRSAP